MNQNIQYQQEGERISNWFADGVKKASKTFSEINTLNANEFVSDR